MACCTNCSFLVTPFKLGPVTGKDPPVTGKDPPVTGKEPPVKRTKTDSLSPRDLSEEEEKRVQEAFTSKKDKIISTLGRLKFYGRDARTLEGTKWLNDEVINFYMQMIEERSSEQKEEGNEDALKVFCHNSFFYAKLRKKNSEGVSCLNYEGVKRWSKKKNKKIFEQDLVMCPINVEGNHWCLAVINFRSRRFEYYDSLGEGKSTQSQTCLEDLREYVKKELHEYVNEEAELLSKLKEYKLDAWQFHVPSAKKGEIPGQKNGCDCGVFTLMYADCLSQGRSLTGTPLPFSAEHMPVFRKRILLSILNGSLE